MMLIDLILKINLSSSYIKQIRYQQEGNGVDKCYLFKDFDEMLTWNEANDMCRSFGGLLVSIHTDEESRMITSRTSRSDSRSFWIGLRVSLLFNILLNQIFRSKFKTYSLLPPIIDCLLLLAGLRESGL